jgi:isopentenyldiphosphate isomerase
MPWTKDFILDDARRTVTLTDASHGADVSSACTAALSEVVARCIKGRIFPNVGGVHSEPIAILGANYPVQIERFAAPLFGTVNRGAHLTVFSRGKNGLAVWVPRRSENLKTYPGMLDSSVAGGVRAGESPLENLVHEAAEEASIPEKMVRTGVQAAGALTMMGLTGKGAAQEGLVFADVLFVFDLEVSDEFKLQPRDEEVKEFYQMDVEAVKRRLLNGEFKNNSAVVMVDFFIRHGFITPEDEDYVELLMRSHRRLEIPLSPKRA